MDSNGKKEDEGTSASSREQALQEIQRCREQGRSLGEIWHNAVTKLKNSDPNDGHAKLTRQIVARMLLDGIEDVAVPIIIKKYRAKAEAKASPKSPVAAGATPKSPDVSTPSPTARRSSLNPAAGSFTPRSASGGTTFNPTAADFSPWIQPKKLDRKEDHGKE